MVQLSHNILGVTTVAVTADMCDTLCDAVITDLITAALMYIEDDATNSAAKF
jgi:hypothetical protein